jgi:hypothetical protein
MLSPNPTPELCRHVMRLLAHRLRETILALAAASFSLVSRLAGYCCLENKAAIECEVGL